MIAVRPHLLAAAVVSALFVALLPPQSAAQQPPPCNAIEVRYTLAANLQLTDTPMGQGDGIYPIGPGTAVLRYENKGGAPGGAVTMVSYHMRELFTIHAKALFWSTDVTTDTHTRATPDACSVAARGALSGRTLRWSTPVSGYRTDGTLTCKGSLCGKFGAPPPGQTPLHIGPGLVQFGPFNFSPDMKTFSMQNTQVSKTEMPKQTGSIALSGREVGRSCVQVQPCR